MTFTGSGATKKVVVDPKKVQGKKNKMVAGGDQAARMQWAQEQKEGIQRCFREIKADLLEPMKASIDKLLETQTAQRVAICEARQKISDNEDEILGLAVKVESHEALHKKWQEQFEGMENRPRRKNLQILGLPEGLEGTAVGAYVVTMLNSLMGAVSFQGPLELEGAHRVLARRPKANEPPRAVLVRFHRFTDRECVLRFTDSRKQSDQE
ncbi:uncharacterized protein [Scyliorhinus torazame]|uniref:uncharacterized protein n=1 Tax=Scyliorhinus torazame TaxID=75743 RepID=UPI003B5BFEDA